MNLSSCTKGFRLALKARLFEDFMAWRSTGAHPTPVNNSKRVQSVRVVLLKLGAVVNVSCLQFWREEKEAVVLGVEAERLCSDKLPGSCRKRTSGCLKNKAPWSRNKVLGFEQFITHSPVLYNSLLLAFLLAVIKVALCYMCHRPVSSCQWQVTGNTWFFTRLFLIYFKTPWGSATYSAVCFTSNTLGLKKLKPQGTSACCNDHDKSHEHWKNWQIMGTSCFMKIKQTVWKKFCLSLKTNISVNTWSKNLWPLKRCG